MKKIETLLQKLLKEFPELKGQEAVIKKALKELIEKKPNARLSKKFKTDLRAKILEKATKKKSANKKVKTTNKTQKKTEVSKKTVQKTEPKQASKTRWYHWLSYLGTGLAGLAIGFYLHPIMFSSEYADLHPTPLVHDYHYQPALHGNFEADTMAVKNKAAFSTMTQEYRSNPLNQQPAERESPSARMVTQTAAPEKKFENTLNNETAKRTDVKQFVQQLKDRAYNQYEINDNNEQLWNKMPQFNKEDIPLLLELAKDTSIISSYSHFPVNPISSKSPARIDKNKTYIMMSEYLLWCVQAIIEKREFASLRPILIKKTNNERKNITSEEILKIRDLYQNWWEEHKNSETNTLPLDNTEYTWE